MGKGRAALHFASADSQIARFATIGGAPGIPLFPSRRGIRRFWAGVEDDTTKEGLSSEFPSTYLVFGRLEGAGGIISLVPVSMGGSTTEFLEPPSPAFHWTFVLRGGQRSTALSPGGLSRGWLPVSGPGYPARASFVTSNYQFRRRSGLWNSSTTQKPNPQTAVGCCGSGHPLSIRSLCTRPDESWASSVVHGSLV